MRLAISRRFGSSFGGQRAEPLLRGAHRKRGQLTDVGTLDLDRERLRTQPRAFADGAGRSCHVAGDVLARPFAFGLAITPFEIADDAFEGLHDVMGAQTIVIGKAHGLLARAMQDHIASLLRQRLETRIEAELEMLGERFEGLQIIGRAGACPGSDRTSAQGELRIRDNQLGVDGLLDTEAAAMRAGAERIVEGEQARLDFGDGEAGHRAGEFGRKDNPLGSAVFVPLIGVFDDRDSVGEFERGLETFR